MAAGIGIAGEGWVLLRDLARGTGSAEAPGVLALLVCIVSIVSKELLYRATDIVGRRLNSPVIRANAAHHRSDVWSSVVALVGVAGSRLGLRSLDPLAAIGVAVMVFNMGLGISVDALGQLTDTTDEKLVGLVKQAARRVVGPTRVLGARARAMGSSWLAEVEVEPDQFVASATAVDHLAAKVRVAVLDAVPTIDECMVNVRSSVARSRILASLATPQELDERVRATLAKLPEVEVTRTMAHFVNFEPSVDVWVKVRPARTVDECHGTAARARTLLLDSVRDISSAEFHLVL
jgi:cation diffusion facilitator family transporter